MEPWSQGARGGGAPRPPPPPAAPSPFPRRPHLETKNRITIGLAGLASLTMVSVHTNDYIMDLLEMKPNKQLITDTVQVDMTKQIADTIAKEEKKLTLQRKSEVNEPVE